MTREQILEVPCIACDAKIDKPCMVGPGQVMIGYHRERLKLRERYPSLPISALELNPTDKALIVYYGFVMLCNSCAANSMKLFGAELSSEAIQRKFAHEAIKELQQDGLLCQPGTLKSEPKTETTTKS